MDTLYNQILFLSTIIIICVLYTLFTKFNVQKITINDTVNTPTAYWKLYMYIV